MESTTSQDSKQSKDNQNYLVTKLSSSHYSDLVLDPELMMIRTLRRK